MVSDAVPFVTEAVPSGVVPSKNVTVPPLGVPALLVMVAAKVSDSPYVSVEAEALTDVAVDDGLIVNVTGAL